MSSRHLRRVQGRIDDALLHEESSGESGDGSSSDTGAGISKASAFAMLMPSDEEDEYESEEEEEEEADEADEEKEHQGDSEEASADIPVPSLSKSPKVPQEEDIDEIIKELGLEDRLKGSEAALEAQNRDKIESFEALLVCDPTKLDAAAEMKHKLGGSIGFDDVKDEIDSLAGQYGMAYGPRAEQAIKKTLSGKIKKASKRRKATNLVTPRPTWPLITALNIGMTLEHYAESQMYYGDGAFVLTPKKEYEDVMEELAMFVDISDIDSIVGILRKHPNHVDALLIVSDFMRMSNSGDANDMIEKAVYILEKALLTCPKEHSVDLTSGTLRMPYSVFENRKMHLALIRYIQSLVKRGCYRTALEVGKILFSLDPFDDPMGVRVIIDFLAVQSGQLAWFDAMWEQIGQESPWLANWHYSAALRAFIADPKSADNLLVNAMKQFPYLVPQLAKSVGIKMDDDEWNAKFALPILEADEVHVGALRETLAKVYAARAGPLWKSPAYSDWLRRCMKLAMSSPWTADNDFPDYRPTPFETLPIFRHAAISDLSGVTVALPTSISVGPMHPYDPLPPELVLEGDKSNWKTRCVIS